MPGALLRSSTTAVWACCCHAMSLLQTHLRHTTGCPCCLFANNCLRHTPFLCLLIRMIPSIWRAIIVAEHVAQYPCWCLPALLPRLPQQEATTLALRSIVRARQRGASASAACCVGASVLVRGAIERGSRDNITVAVVDLRSREESSSVGITSVASVLASQCSSDLSAWVAGGNSRKRRSSSGNDDEDGLPVPSAGVLQLQPLMAHSSLGAVRAAGGAAGNKSGGAGKPPTGPKGEAGGGAAARGGSSSNGSCAAGNARRHTVSTTEAGGSSSSTGGCTPAPSSNGGNTGRTQGMAWGWSLQGLQLLPHSPQPHPTSSIRALAQAAAAAVAAFSGTFGTLDRGVSGIPREATTSPAAAAAAAAGGSTAPVPAAAAGVVAPATPSMGELLSMQSAPALRQGASGRSSGGGGKPPLPRH
jgi:hypothetical protein